MILTNPFSNQNAEPIIAYLFTSRKLFLIMREPPIRVCEVKDVSDLFDFLMKEHESRNAKLIRLYHESNQYDLRLDAEKEKLRWKQGQDFLASIQN
ncbi:MAG: hypothetical protein ACE5PV_15875 [Candidatus Poribacteria bacterium]